MCLLKYLETKRKIDKIMEIIFLSELFFIKSSFTKNFSNEFIISSCNT